MSSMFALIAGAIVVASGILTVTRRNPIHAALSMLVALGGVAVLMLGLHAPFLAAMQVLLYGGAIMVLFTFVIMLLTLREEEMGPEPATLPKALAFIGAFAVLAMVWGSLAGREAHFPAPALGDAFGSTEHFARFLYTDYVIAFELVTVLVMAAVAGVIALARRSDSATLLHTKFASDAAHPHGRQQADHAHVHTHPGGVTHSHGHDHAHAHAHDHGHGPGGGHGHSHEAINK